MTTSVSSAETSMAVAQPATPVAKTSSPELRVYRIRHTLPSRFAFLVICIAIVLSALAYGTVHYWALGLFNLGGLTMLVLWVLDAWSLGNFRVSRNLLQLRLLGAIVLGLVQLMPLGQVSLNGATTAGFVHALS